MLIAVERLLLPFGHNCVMCEREGVITDKVFMFSVPCLCYWNQIWEQVQWHTLHSPLQPLSDQWQSAMKPLQFAHSLVFCITHIASYRSFFLDLYCFKTNSDESTSLHSWNSASFVQLWLVAIHHYPLLLVLLLLQLPDCQVFSFWDRTTLIIDMYLCTCMYTNIHTYIHTVTHTHVHTH